MRPRLFLLLLVIPMNLTLPLRAQQKILGPTLRSAFCSGGVPTAGRRSETAATVASASACAAMLPALPAGAQQNPTHFTQDQVQGLVRDGLGDDSGAKLIEQRGIDFAPAEDFLQSLKAAGASEAFLKALRTAKPPEPASAKKPLNQVQIFALLAGQISSHRVAMLVNTRGLDFEPQQDYLDEVRLGGGDDELINALKNAKVTKPATIDPAAQARQAEVRQHMARVVEYIHGKRYADANSELQAWLELDPENDDLHVLQGTVLEHKGNWDGAVGEFREALRLNPENDHAHTELGTALGHNGDWHGAIAEFHEALRLNPGNDRAHAGLGPALGAKGDNNGEIAEERAALLLNPNNETAHVELGHALAIKGDLDGAIAEEGKALRSNPNDDRAHFVLGLALQMKGDFQGALRELREAYELNPEGPNYRQAYEQAINP